MKMKIRLLFISIITFIIGIIPVLAENIIVDNFSVSSKTDTTTVSGVTFDNTSLNSNIEFNQINDYVEFLLDISVDDGDTWTVKSVTDDLTSDNVTLEYTYTDTSSPISIKISYTGQVTESVSVDDFVISIVLEKEDKTIEETINVNPKTKDNFMKYILIAGISLALLLITRNMIKNDKYKSFIPMIALLVFIPSIIFASEILTSNIKLNFSSIKINYNTFTVTYNSNGGTSVSSETVIQGLNATKPTNPTKAKYKFVAWLDEDGSEFDFSTPIEKDVNLTADWLYTYTFLQPGLTVNKKFSLLGGKEIYEYIGAQYESIDDLVDAQGFSSWIEFVGNVYLEPLTVEECVERGYIDMSYSPDADSILRASELPDDFIPTDDNTISDASSVYPVYIWKDDNNNINYYSEADTIYLNADSSHLFSNLTNATSIDLSPFDTSEVTNMKRMFDSSKRLEELDLSNFDTSNVTDMSYMFKNCFELKDLDLSNFNTSNVTDMSYMFYYCTSLTHIDVSSFDTSNVTTINNMFGWVYELEELDVSNFNTSKVVYMYGAFSNMYKIKSLDLSNFDTSNVVTMQSVFASDYALESIDVSSWNTSKAHAMGAMFYSCTSLTEIDISSFTFSHRPNINNLFYNDANLKIIYASDNFPQTGFPTSGVFAGCTSLVGGAGTTWSSASTTSTMAIIDEGSSNPGYFTRK